LALLNLVGQKLAATLDLQEIFDLLLQAVTETIGAEGSSVWLQAEDDAGGLICHAAYLHDQHQLPVNLRLPSGQGIAGWVVENGRPVVISNVDEDPRHAPIIDTEIEFETASILAVPLRIGHRVFGALEVVNKFDGRFNSDDQSIVETLAASAAIAIENARLVTALRQQTEELQTRNAELDAFAHTVAHDLKTPLGPLIGLADFLAEHRHELQEEDVNSSLYSVKSSGLKMNNIIDELLLLAQMRDKEIEVTRLDMTSIVGESEQRLSYMIDESQAEVIMPDDWPNALGYGPWIEEVWVNYISNAIKYGGKPPRIKLGATSIDDEHLIRFWVHDNGAGLSPEEQAKLFVPFSQVDKIRAEGHGLGLSIVRRIVERLGGEVGVESEGTLAQGSLFYFTLPLAPPENGKNG
jgi:signal transduction histidine kinase